MDFIKKVTLLAVILTTEQVSYSSENLANYMQMQIPNQQRPAPSKSSQQYKDADQLVAESYVTPEQQFAVFTLMKKPFVLNKVTGTPVYSETQSMPTVTEILSATSGQSTFVTLKALESVLEAVKTAEYVAALEASYDINNQNYYWYQTASGMLTNILNDYQSKIKSAIANAKKTPASGGSDDASYSVRERSSDKDVMITASIMNHIITNNNFKTLAANPNDRASIQRAATLLFKECFIAQKNFNAPNLGLIKMNPDKGIYIFDNYPDMNGLINIVNNRLSNTNDKHELLKAIRQAVQTALFIAKQNSTYYVTTDPLVQALKDMDSHISKLYLNPSYGATQEDINRAGMWSNLTNIAAGAAVVGAAGAAYYASQNPDDVKAIAQQAQDFVGDQTTYLSQQASDATAYLSQKATDTKEYAFGKTSMTDKVTNKMVEINRSATEMKNKLAEGTDALLNKLGVSTETPTLTDNQLEINSSLEKQYIPGAGFKSYLKGVSEEEDVTNAGVDRTWSEFFEHQAEESRKHNEKLGLKEEN